MNKEEYQKALDSITTAMQYDYEAVDYNPLSWQPKLDLLQQLIDKLPYHEELEERDTPMRPRLADNFRYVCECTRPLSEFDNYCPQCGKRLDWNEKEK